jgi:cytochrome P450 family 135
VPTAMRKLARPAKLGGYAVPAGWLVTPAIPLLHADPARWADGGEFRPDRYRRHDGDASVCVPREWMPFGGGLRMCIGQHLAVLELKIVLREALTRVSVAATDRPARRPGRPAERPRSRYSMLVPSKRARLIVTGRLIGGLCGQSRSCCACGCWG